MERQQRHGRRRHHDALSDEARLVAERLEQLSVDDAERVLERAIALQQQRDDQAGAERMMDRATLQRIADELEIDHAHLERALVEELYRLDAEDPTWIDRLTVPASVRASGVVPLSAAQTRTIVDLWMERHEGMRKQSDRSGVAGWKKNPSLAASARRALRMSDSSGFLRRANDVSTRVRPATASQSVVAVEADTSGLRSLAVAAASATVAAVASGLAVAAGSALAGDGGLVGPAVATGATAGLLGGGVWLGVRMWVDRIRSAAKSAVSSITNPHLIRDRSIPGIIGELVAEWSDFAGDLSTEMRSKRRPQ